MRKIFSLLASIAGLPNLRAYAITAAIAVSVGFSAGFGSSWWLRDQMAARKELGQVKHDAVVVVAAARQAIVAGDKASAASQKLGEAAAAKQQQTRIVYRTLEKEVTRYVTKESDARCVVPVGFVRVFNAAAVGDPAAPAGGAPAGEPDAQPSGVELSDVLANDVFNAGIYYQVVDQLRALQAWERERQAREESRR
jgi:hypothetical protein